MDPDFGERHHHLYYDHLRFTGLHETFQWLPLLAGILATVAVAWILLILLGGDRFQQSQPTFGLPSTPDPARQRCMVRCALTQPPPSNSRPTSAPLPP